MNYLALIAGVGGALYGGRSVHLIAVEKRRWAGYGTLALGTAFLLQMAMPEGSAHSAYRVVYWFSIPLFAIFALAFIVDGYTRRKRTRSVSQTSS